MHLLNCAQTYAHHSYQNHTTSSTPCRSLPPFPAGQHTSLSGWVGRWAKVSSGESCRQVTRGMLIELAGGRGESSSSKQILSPTIHHAHAFTAFLN